MKRTIIIFTTCIALSFSAYAFIRAQQNEAVISIYKPSGMLFVRDRSVLQRTPNYELKKIDGQNYTLIYKGDIPKILYMNDCPIYITPGDKVQLSIHYIREPGMERDTIIAKGLNAKNYTYSYLTFFDTKERKKARGMNYPNTNNPKYSNINSSFYSDRRKYCALDWKYVDSILKARNYDKNIIRQAELDDYTIKIFGDRFIEDEFSKTNKIQFNDFAKKLDNDFSVRNIVPRDTMFSLNIEGAISLYFDHLEKVKFSGVKTDSQLSEMISYISRYPNQFVREYFLYFLMQNYKPRLKGNLSLQIKPELDKIKNPILIAALENKVKRTPSVPEGFEFLNQ